MPDHNRSDDTPASGRDKPRGGFSQNELKLAGSPGKSTGKQPEPKSTDSGVVANEDLQPSEHKELAQPASETSTDSDSGHGPFDFGGLPNRNLKRNLGCG